MNPSPPDPNLTAWLGDVPEKSNPDLLTAGLDKLYAAGPDAAAKGRAQDNLRAALEDERANQVYYQELPQTPLGDIYLAVAGRNVIALNFGVDERVFLNQIQKRAGAKAIRSVDQTAEAAQQVRDYLAGKRTRFDLAVDLRTLTEFQRQVLLTTADVPRGQVRTYSEIARAIGRPRAYRAVGQALGQNPIPIIIPCHRVIASDGSLGGYSGGGGAAAKAHLLELEGYQGEKK